MLPRWSMRRGISLRWSISRRLGTPWASAVAVSEYGYVQLPTPVPGPGSEAGPLHGMPGARDPYALHYGTPYGGRDSAVDDGSFQELKWGGGGAPVGWEHPGMEGGESTE